MDDDLRVSRYDDDIQVVVDAAFAVNGQNGAGVAQGGVDGQVLVKKSGVDFDTEWQTPTQWVPPNGLTGQVLTKASATSLDMLWANIPPGLPAGGDTDWVLSKLSPSNYDVTWKPAVDASIFVAKSGSVMTGPLTLYADPTLPLQAATMQYVDAADALAMPKTGGTFTGAVAFTTAAPIGPTPPLGVGDSRLATTAYVDATADLYLPLVGGALTNFLSLHADPTSALHAATKQYVDGKVAPYLPLVGGTLSGALTVSSGNIIASGGSISLDRAGDAADALMFLSVDPSFNANIHFRTSGLARWVLGKASDAEGVNTGSSFTLQAYSNAGSFLGYAFIVARATQIVAFTQIPTAPTPTAGDNTTKLATTAFVNTAISGSGLFLPLAGGTLTGDLRIDRDATNVELQIDSDSGRNSTLRLRTNGLARWAILKSTEVESTSDIGSNFQLNAYHDDGTFIGNVIKATRATRIVEFLISPIAPTPIAGDNTTQLATTAFVTAAAALKASLTGASFTGDVTTTGFLATTSSYIQINRVGDAADANIYLDIDAGRATIFNLRSPTTMKWRFGMFSNTDFLLQSYDDAVTQGTVFTIPRVSRIVAFTLSPTAPTPTSGDATTKLATTAFVATAVAGATSGGVPAGGAINQVLAKASATNYDMAWVDPAGVGTFLPLTGGTLSNFLTLHANPTSALHAATKQYVDTADALFMPKTGGTFTGAIAVPAPVSGMHPTTKDYVDTALALKANLLSPTFTGSVNAPTQGPGTNTTEVATTAFVMAADAFMMPKTGGTFTGAVAVPAPVSGMHPTTKDYVDLALVLKANLAGPTNFTGSITAPTQGPGTNTTEVATTAFVAAAFAALPAYLPLGGGTLVGTLIQSGGDIVINRVGDAATGFFTVDVDAGRAGYIRWQTAGVDRWYMGKNSNTEAGGDLGSLFQFEAFSNAGASLGNVFTVTRGTRILDFKISPTAPTVTPSTVSDTRVATTAFVQAAIAGGGGAYVPIAGEVTMTGPLYLPPATPVFASEAAHKGYVDTQFALKANIASPAFTGNPTAVTQATGDNSTRLATTAFVQAEIVVSAFLPLTGGELTGVLNMDSNKIIDLANPSNPFDAANKGYIDTQLALKANLASPAFTGIPTTPTPAVGDNSTKVATTEFVQKEVSIVTLRSMGVPINGTTECSALISAAINSIPDGTVLDGESYTYKINSQVTNATIKHRITLQNIVFDASGFANNASTPAIYIKGALGVSTTCSETLDAGEYTLNVLDATGFGGQDWVFIRHPSEYWSQDHGALKSEIHQLNSGGGTTLGIYGGMYYAMAANAIIWKIDFCEDWKLTNVKVIGPYYGAIGINDGVRFSYCRNLIVDGCRLEGFDAHLFQFQRCLSSKAINSYFGNGVGELGYGVQIVDGCHDITVAHNSFENVREGIDLGNYSSTNGVNRQVIIGDNIFNAILQKGVNSHGSGDIIAIEGNIINCDPNAEFPTLPGTKSSGACYIRCTNVTYKNNRCLNSGDDAITYSNMVSAVKASFTATDNECFGCFAGGVLISNDDFSIGMIELDISKNKFECAILSSGVSAGETFTGITVVTPVSSYDKIKIVKNTISGFEDGILVTMSINSKSIDVSNNDIAGIAAKVGSLALGIYLTAASSDVIKTNGNTIKLFERCIIISHLTSGFVKYVAAKNNELEPYSNAGAFHGINIASDVSNAFTRGNVSGNVLLQAQSVGIRAREIQYLIAVGNDLALSATAIDISPNVPANQRFGDNFL